MAVLARTQRNSTVTPRPTSRCSTSTAARLQALFADVPQIAVKMLPVVAGRVVENSDHHTD